jgi:DNA end-binding protein Ku
MPATVWRGRISFGLVSIPVRLYKAARRERIRFHNVHRASAQPAHAEEPEPEEHWMPETQEPAPRTAAAEPELEPGQTPEPVARIRSTPVSAETETPVAPAEILKGYELAKDEYVVLHPREIAALRPQTSTELEITQFAELKDIDPLYFDTSYYVSPEPGGEKPYAVLFRTLLESGRVGLGTLSMHGRRHATVIRAGSRGLILHTLFYANEVGSATEYQADPNLVGTKELDLAKLLVDALTAKFEPAALKDTFEENLRALIESRAPVPAAGGPHRAEERKAPVIDIMEALRKSLEKARKPVKREQAPAKPRSRRAK